MGKGTGEHSPSAAELLANTIAQYISAIQKNYIISSDWNIRTSAEKMFKRYPLLAPFDQFAITILRE